MNFTCNDKLLQTPTVLDCFWWHYKWYISYLHINHHKSTMPRSTNLEVYLLIFKHINLLQTCVNDITIQGKQGKTQAREGGGGYVELWRKITGYVNPLRERGLIQDQHSHVHVFAWSHYMQYSVRSSDLQINTFFQQIHLCYCIQFYANFHHRGNLQQC